jgi:hypothetical protein
VSEIRIQEKQKGEDNADMSSLKGGRVRGG